MIAYIKGVILEKTERSAIVLTNGVGYEVFLSLRDLQKVEKSSQQEFFIYSYIRQDSFDLYGFQNLSAIDLFKKLLLVSGVGPKSAINILGLAEVDDLKKAITSGDPSFFQKVSGVGKKTAERIVVELKEKFINDISNIAGPIGGDRQVIEALLSLGYKEKEAMEMVKKLQGDEIDLSAKIKKVLQN